MKEKKKKSTKKLWERERERERTFFCEGKVCKEWKIYSKRLWIKKDKKIKGKMKNDIKVEGSGEMKM